MSVFGRLISGLAETLLFYQSTPATSAAERAARQRETAQLLSIAGMILPNTPRPPGCSPALFARIARTLTTAADLTDNDALTQALRRDATRARTAATAAHPRTEQRRTRNLSRRVSARNRALWKSR